MVQPRKMSSQFTIGGPVCIDPTTPKSKSAWTKQKILYGSMDPDTDSYPKPVVSASKARELAGHINVFGTPPCVSPPPAPIQEQSDIAYSGSKVDVAESARQVYKTKMKALKGHNAVFLDCEPCCKPQQAEIQPLRYAKAQELRGNDIFAAMKPNSGTLCNNLQI